MRRPILILATALALSAAACGDDDDSADGAATELEADAREAASEARGEASELASEAEDRASELASEAEDATEAIGERVNEADMAEQADRLVEELRERNLTNVASFIEAVGLENLIQSESFTLLAPTDDAFLALDRSVLAGLLADPREGLAILQNHVIDERLDGTALAAEDSVEAASGTRLAVSAQGDQITVGGATVTEADIDVGGGVVHIIDTVITERP